MRRIGSSNRMACSLMVGAGSAARSSRRPGAPHGAPRRWSMMSILRKCERFQSNSFGSQSPCRRSARQCPQKHGVPRTEDRRPASHALRNDQSLLPARPLSAACGRFVCPAPDPRFQSGGSGAGEFPARSGPVNVNIPSRPPVNTKQGLTVRSGHAYSPETGMCAARPDARNGRANLITTAGQKAGGKGQGEHV